MIALIQPPIDIKREFPKLSNAPTGLFLVMRPREVSAMIKV